MDSIQNRLTAVALLAGVAGALPPEAGAAELFPGPVRANVLEVLDGDTFLAEAIVWPGHTVTINIRVRGIDAPEMRSRCPAEQAAAQKARLALSDLLARGAVSISNIGSAKYYGRVLADVTAADGAAVAASLIDRALVRSYAGGKRESWCG